MAGSAFHLSHTFLMSCSIIILQWYSSISATQGVIMQIADTAGIEKPRLPLPVVEGGGLGSGIVFAPP